MKKRIFDGGLYLEGLKQLRLIGIMSLVILALGAILIPVAYISPGLESLSYMSSVEVSPRSVSLLDIHPLVLLSFCVIAPLMTLYLFGFLNKRNTSDFYHAIPQTRICIYLSFFAAIVTWLVAIIVSTTAIATILMSCFPRLFFVNLNSVFIMGFNMIAASLFITGAVAIAMCVTGTTFTNIAVALLLIFLPRFLILLFTKALASALPVICPTYFLPLLDLKYNVASGFVLSFFATTFEDALSILTNWQSGVYTLVVGLIYAGIGLILFRCRKSESAAQSAPNRVLQTVFRLAVTMPICAATCMYIFSEGIVSKRLEFLPVLILYAITLVVYFLYELITTRRFKNLLRAVPALGILVALNLGMLGGLYLSRKVILETRPTAEQIESVRLIRPDRYADEDYFTSRTAQIDLTDPTIKEIIARNLEKDLIRIEQGYPYAYDEEYGESICRLVKIRYDGKAIYRYIGIREADVQTFLERLKTVEDYRRIYQELPPIDVNTSVWLNARGLYFPEADVQAIYEQLRQEVQAMDFQTWYMLLTGGAYSSSCMDGSLYITTTVGVRTFSICIPLTDDLPKTSALYLQKLQAVQKPQLQEVIAFLQKEKWGPDTWFYLEHSHTTDAQGQPFDSSLSLYPKDEKYHVALQNLAALLRDGQSLSLTPGGPCLALEISDYSKPESVHFYIVVPLAEATLPDCILELYRLESAVQGDKPVIYD